MAEFLNKNIKYLRLMKKISQQKLADMIGVNRSTISRIENDEIETTIDNAYKISVYFNIPLGDLVSKDLSLIKYKDKEDKEKENVNKNRI